MPLSHLIQSRRVILCAGSGGVGKTTTAAAIGLAAARLGRRTLCLTIDPAKRLAQSLGLDQFDTDARLVEPSRFRDAGLAVPGSLTVMMLDTKRTFDQIVERHASSPEARDRILHNKLYHYVSTALAGTQEYMAMEKLHEVKQSPDFDLIVLDTPPTANALDFLDAPERMIDALDSAAMRWFLQAFQSTGRLSFNLLARSAALAIRGIGRFTGGGFLEDLAAFLAEINDLFGGFRQRAREVELSLRAPDVAFVLVSSTSPLATAEALFFADRLASMRMSSDALVVNRVHLPPRFTPSEADISAAVSRSGLGLGPAASMRLLSALRDELREAELDERRLRSLDEALRRFANPPARVDVPAFPRDVHDLSALDRIARVLVRQLQATSPDACHHV